MGGDGDRLSVTDVHGNGHAIRFSFDAQGDIDGVDVDIDLAGGLRLRDARPDDYPVLEAVEASSGIPFGDGHCFIERRGSLEDALGLFGDGSTQVIEDDEGLLAFGGMARVPTRVGSVDHRFNYAHHHRILERGRRRGLVRALSIACDRPIRRDTEGVISVVHGDNVRGVATRDCPWETTGTRLLLASTSLAGAGPGARPVDPSEADELAAMLNHAHRSEQWFVPYDGAYLRERLARRPKAYGWEQVRRSDRAVLGIWWSGEGRRYRLPDREWAETRAVVMDFGFDEGGEEELVGLLRSAAVEAQRRGVTHLSVMSSEGSRSWPLLRPLANRTEPYFVSCTVPEPAEAAKTGLYLDPVLA